MAARSPREVAIGPTLCGEGGTPTPPRGRGQALEAPSLALNEGGVNRGPDRPPLEGDRVVAGDAPLRRRAPVTGGTVLREARPGDVASLVGYLQGGAIINWQRGRLLRFVLNEAVLVAALGEAPPLPSQSRSPPPPPFATPPLSPPPPDPQVGLFN